MGQLRFGSLIVEDIPGANHGRLHALDIIEGVAEVIDICVQASDAATEQEVRRGVQSIPGK